MDLPLDIARVDGASDVLRGYPLWFPAASLSADDIADALVKAGHAALEADVETLRAAREFGASFSRDRQLSPRVEALTASTGVPA